jgi:hypothetical protein
MVALLNVYQVRSPTEGYVYVLVAYLGGYPFAIAMGGQLNLPLICRSRSDKEV